MIRPLKAEIIRYGTFSKPEDSIYDHPFQWGSKRTGPDLANVGGKYPDSWHYYHMKDPRRVTPKSIMPEYPWLYKNRLDLDSLSKKIGVMKQLGVPYTDEQVGNAVELAETQAKEISKTLESQGVPKGSASKEIIALIAYLKTLKPMETK
jgi:cytochrome c oxidase cbb3-type subunit I/II